MVALFVLVKVGMGTNRRSNTSIPAAEAASSALAQKEKECEVSRGGRPPSIPLISTKTKKRVTEGCGPIKQYNNVFGKAA